MSLFPVRAATRTASSVAIDPRLDWHLSLTSGSQSRAAVRAQASSRIYQRAAIQLLPPGRAFDAVAGSILWMLCDALSREASRIAAAIEEVIADIAPTASNAWHAIFGRDPAEVGAAVAAEGPVTWAELVSALPDSWVGVALSYTQGSVTPSTAGVLRAGQHLTSDRGRWMVWVEVHPASSLASAQLTALKAAVRAAALPLIPPTCSLRVDIVEV